MSERNNLDTVQPETKDMTDVIFFGVGKEQAIDKPKVNVTVLGLLRTFR